MSEARNPWTAQYWNLTEQGRIVREQGAQVATVLADAAGTTLNGPRPPLQVNGQFVPVPKSNFTVLIQQKGSRGGRGAVNVIGAGSSGNGAPE